MDAGNAEGEADVVALNQDGRRLFEAGRYDEARVLFVAAARDPSARGAALNIAHCDLRMNRLAAAEAQVHQLVAADPSFVPAWETLAEVLAADGRDDEAMKALDRALQLAPGFAPLWRRRGDILQRAKMYEDACDSYRHALTCAPDDVRSLASLVTLKRSLCDWEGIDQLSAAVRHSVQAGRGVMQPLSFLNEGADAAEQRFCAEAWIRQRVKRSTVGPIDTAPGTPPRIGFVSYGFGGHATAVLTSALIEELITQGVDLQLFCTGPNDRSRFRRRLEAAAVIHDVEGQDPVTFADRVRALKIDVLVDLDGYSRERVPSVFAQRPCHLQLAWLGFPGTTGGEFFDYVIADRFVLPPELATHFTEPVAWLPRCYQPNDSTRVLTSPPPRSAFGLPESAIVYVCFNAPQKLNPRSFGRMMRVLREVPDSVLWLLEGPGRGPERLRTAASALGVAPGRLIFMPKSKHAAYLAAYRHAALFLDTEHYNAHTTASDAMWAGCPVLTRPGDTFASRVAGSLNHHAGLHELNVPDDDAYVDLAVRFGKEPAFRAAVAGRLDEARRSSPLFDPKGFAADLMALIGDLLSRRPDRANRP